jgi:WD40 repeat protein
VKTPKAILEPRGELKLDDYIVDIAWSTDTTRLAVAGGEGKVFLAKRSAFALEACEVGQHGMGALAVAWRPGGSAFASSGQDSRITLFDAEGALVAQQRPSMNWTTALAWSPDGQRLATATGKQISLWTPSLVLEHAFASLASTVTALGWDKPGRDLAAAMNGGLVVHRVEPPRFQLRHYKWPAPCLTAAFSPSSRFLATGTQDGTVHFWHLSTGRDSQMRGYPGRVDGMSWSGDSRYLATAADEQIVLWDFGGKGPEGSRPLQLRGHTDRIECLAFQPGGNYLVTGGRDWRLSLWLPGKATTALDAQLTVAEPTCLRWSPDGRFVAAGERNGRLSIYELVRIV